MWYRFIVPYTQEQRCLGIGEAVGLVEAKSKTEARQKVRRLLEDDSGTEGPPGRGEKPREYIEFNEENLEMIDSQDMVFDPERGWEIEEENFPEEDQRELDKDLVESIELSTDVSSELIQKLRKRLGLV